MWGGKIMQQQKCSETGNKKQQWDCENMSPVRLASGFLYHTTDEDFCHRWILFFDENSDFVDWNRNIRGVYIFFTCLHILDYIWIYQLCRAMANHTNKNLPVASANPGFTLIIRILFTLEKNFFRFLKSQ